LICFPVGEAPEKIFIFFLNILPVENFFVSLPQIYLWNYSNAQQLSKIQKFGASPIAKF
jgi:hypothetical protein